MKRAFKLLGIYTTIRLAFMTKTVAAKEAPADPKVPSEVVTGLPRLPGNVGHSDWLRRFVLKGKELDDEPEYISCQVPPPMFPVRTQGPSPTQLTPTLFLLFIHSFVSDLSGIASHRGSPP